MLQLPGSAGLMFTAMQERLDRLRRLAQRDEAVAALLVEAAEARVMPLEHGEGLQGIGDAMQVALGDGNAQQPIASAGDVRAQPRGCGQHRLELVLAQQRTDVCHIRRLGRGGGCGGRCSSGGCGVGHVHEWFIKKGRTPRGARPSFYCTGWPAGRQLRLPVRTCSRSGTSPRADAAEFPT